MDKIKKLLENHGYHQHHNKYLKSEPISSLSTQK
jgi:hypothetical protein